VSWDDIVLQGYKINIKDLQVTRLGKDITKLQQQNTYATMPMPK